MLLSHLSTMNNNVPLKSGGMLSITAYQGNEQLYMANGKSYSAQLPAVVPDNSMIAFISLSDSGQGRNWSTIDTSQYDSTYYGINNFYADIIHQASSYLYTSNWLGWINCDTWYGAAYPNIVANWNQSAEGFDMLCYLILNDNSAIRLNPISVGSLSTPAPLDSSGTLVAFGVKDSILYSAFVPLTVTNNLEISFTLQPTTTDDFKAAIDLLN